MAGGGIWGAGMGFRAYPAYCDSGVEWLGEVPVGWGVKRLKWVASINDEALSERADPGMEIAYVDIGSIDHIQGITNKEILAFGDAPSRARRVVRDGDVILSTVRTYLRAIAPIRNPEKNLIVSTGFAVIRPLREMLSSYAVFALQAPYFIERVVAESVGVGYPAINASDVGCLPIAYPSLAEQREIATYLDRETGKIDELIGKKEGVIGLLRERRGALISQAVTKGLDSGARMKDSGVEWLGKIPAEWRVVRNKEIFVEVDDRSETGEETLLAVSEYYGVKPRAEVIAEGEFLSRAESLVGYKRLRTDDLAMNFMLAWKSGLGFSPCEGIISPAYAVFRLKSREANPGYLHYLLRSPHAAAEFKRWSYGIIDSRLRLYPDVFLSLRCLLPPLAEQREIAAYLDRETGKIDALIGKVEGAIALLREYRAALISAAVTGKIDVREREAA